MIIVGGLGSIEGTIFGVIFVTGLKELIFVIGLWQKGNYLFYQLVQEVVCSWSLLGVWLSSF
jgi:ABC-type branched-subunit amino acid transport system permease subunit